MRLPSDSQRSRSWVRRGAEPATILSLVAVLVCVGAPPGSQAQQAPGDETYQGFLDALSRSDPGQASEPPDLAQAGAMAAAGDLDTGPAESSRPAVRRPGCRGEAIDRRIWLRPCKGISTKPCAPNWPSWPTGA